MSDDDFNYDEIEERFRRAVLKDKAEEAKLRRKKKKKRIIFNPRPLIFLLIIVGLIFGVKSFFKNKPKEKMSVAVEQKRAEPKQEPAKASESVNTMLVDNIVYKDFIEDTTVKKDKKQTKLPAAAQTTPITEITKGGVAAETVTAGALKTMTTEELESNMPKKGSYTIQIAAGKSIEGSKILADNLVKAGYPAQCVKEGTMYRVLIGNFKTREEAITYGNSLQAKRVIKYFYPRFKN
jgi:cell division septation protein DedD